MAAQSDRGVPYSTLSPKYLHSNSTSHTGPFSAIAELIDNAYDPDVNAKHFWIDKTEVKGELCLSFMDNGNGLDHDSMHKMLSFGYSDKATVKGVVPIGIYGNGFKSGSMRLGKDAIVFSKSKSTSCVGMLSQTYLEKIDANQIVVPIVSFGPTASSRASFPVREEDRVSLQEILQYSPFTTQKELLDELTAISAVGKTGTRIIIWNLRRTSAGTLEYDFAKDRYDVRIPTDLYESESKPVVGVLSHVPKCVYSLRAYCSILYMKPRMQIIIRGQEVKSKLITKSLALTKKDSYKPIFLNRKSIAITFGYNTESKEQYGIMMYHKNRLIKAYERVGCQNKANYQGVGVIGIIECNYLHPTHNKQNFDETDQYRKTIINLGTKLEEYWKEIRYKWTKENPDSTTSVEDTTKQPDQNWVQCNDCASWRKLPDGIDCSKLPEKWFCHMNPDPQFRSCQAEEEPEDSDDDKPPYRKTYRQQEREVKKRQKNVPLPTTPRSTFSLSAKSIAPAAHSPPVISDVRSLAAAPTRAKRTQPVSPHFTPKRPRERRKSLSPERLSHEHHLEIEFSDDDGQEMNCTESIASAARSPSNDLPVISNVLSLAEASTRAKRTQPVSPHLTPKRPRERRKSLSPVRPSMADASPLCPPSVSEEDDTPENDDDLVILEDASTPCPALDKVIKTEKETIDSDVRLVLEFSDDAAQETNAATTSSTGCAAVGAEPSPVMTTTTTQTAEPKVKQEETDQIAAEQSVIKQESVDQEQQTSPSAVTHHLERGEAAGPSCVDGDPPPPHPSMTEVQEQQDQLLEMMDAAAQERDSFKEQVDILTYRLQEMQSRLQEPPRVNVKVTYSDQASQTEGEIDYKSLFEKAKEKVDELIKDKEALLAAAESDPRPGQGDEEDDDGDEIALQVDNLMRELDQRNKEREELRSQLFRLEEDKLKMAAHCEELQSSLQTLRGNAQDKTS